MPDYYLTKRTNFTGTRAVHKEGCPFLQKNNKSIYLGNFSTSNNAIWKARMIFDNSSACIFCAKEGVAMNAPAYAEWNMFSTS
jgi:hypothetical protein